MMQTTDLRNRDHLAVGRRFYFALDRRVSLQREMRSRVQVVVEVRSQDAPQLAIIQDDDMVETLTTDRTDEAFAIRILPGRARCDEHLLDAHDCDARTECAAVD